MSTPDEREDVHALLQSPGWQRVLSVARAQWGGEGYGRQIKLAIAKAKAEGADVSASVAAVDAAQDAVNQLMTWPEDRLRELDTKADRDAALERQVLTRRGGL